MVASGLVDRPDVSHIRLAIHLMAALFIFAGLIWTALDLKALARDPAARPARMPTAAIWALSLLALQIMFGAYVAGLDAGYAYASWPKMGEEWFPADAPMLEPWLRNLADNPNVVQFIHRWLAFVVALAVYMLGFKALDKGVRGPGIAVILAVTLQILLGIATLLTGVAIEIAVAHQATAALLLASVVTAGHGLGTKALPLDGGGLGGGERIHAPSGPHKFTPTPKPLPIKGRGFERDRHRLRDFPERCGGARYLPPDGRGEACRLRQHPRRLPFDLSLGGQDRGGR